MVERASGDDHHFQFLDSGLETAGLASSVASVSEVRLKTVLETMGDGVLITNDRGRILMVNAAFETMLGFEAREVLGRDISLVMAWRDRQKENFDVQTLSSPILGMKGGDLGEVVAKAKDGRNLFVDIRLSEARSRSGQQFVFLLKDFKEREIVHARLDEIRRQLLKPAGCPLQEETGAVLAHELNQPLTALALYLKAFRLKADQIGHLDEDLVQILEKTSREADRAAQIVQRLRRVNKHHTEKLVLTDVNQLIGEVLDRFVFGDKGGGVKIEMKLSENLPALAIDPVQIEQILVNLLKNAEEAMENAPFKKITMTSSLKREFVAITVSDTGCGLAHPLQKTLFKTCVSSKTSGMGLGLAISNAIAQGHGGHFTVDAGGEGRGAAFTLNLPARSLLDAGGRCGRDG